MIDLFQFAEQSRKRADLGIARSSIAAGEEWGDYALGFVRTYLETHSTLFTDDLWESGLEKPTSPRALGAVLQHAARSAWMEEQTDPSTGAILSLPSAASNGQLKRIWKSKIYNP